MPETSDDITFSCPALPSRDLFVASLEGVEAISHPYRFELVVQCDDELGLGRDEIETLLHRNVVISLSPDGSQPVHGILDEIEMLSIAALRPVRYRVVIVPRFASLSRGMGSWVYQDVSVPDIVRTVLRERWGFTPDDFEFRLSQPHAKLEYVVQFQESDFDFLSRWLEREGIFYWFEHGEEREKVVFADANEAFNPPPGLERIGYDARASNSDRTPHVTAISRIRRRSPRQVLLRDYNYRTPRIALEAAAPIDPHGEGTRAIYGDHFKTPDDAKVVARTRAQEIAVPREQYGGRSNARQLAPGRKVTLEEHLDPTFDEDYVLLEVRHHATQGTSTEADDGSHGYANEFVAIPLSVPFRPARTTPWPRIDGVLHARIDGEAQTGVRAPLDEQGRYKVLLPWDLGGVAGGRASRWMRMMQPMTGQNYGVHMPLDIGTEVLLFHIDGDPDRPVIAGSVPTFQTRSTVTRDNASQSVVRTRSGIQIRFEDDG